MVTRIIKYRNDYGTPPSVRQKQHDAACVFKLVRGNLYAADDSHDV
jgi:hypothetical protein